MSEAASVLDPRGIPRGSSTEPRRGFDAEVVVLSAGNRDALVARGEQLRRTLADRPDLALADLAYTLNCPLPDTGPGGARLAIVATSVTDLRGKLTRALRRLADTGCHRIEEPDGVYFTDAPLHAPGALAFVFPGQGAQYVNMLADLRVHFPEVRASFDLMDQAFAQHGHEWLPSQVVFVPHDEHPPAGPAALWAMDCGTAVVYAADQALHRLLDRLDIRPHAVAGHSAGACCALEAADAVRFDETEIVWQALGLNERFHREGRIPTGVLLAVGTPDREQALALVHRSNGALTVAMDNCPHQVVLGGCAEAAAEAAAELGRAGAVCATLPFDHPYHTPALAEFSDRLHGLYEQLEFSSPRLPLYSCATAARCPNDPEAVRRLVAEQWSRPVRFRETVEAMHRDGVRIFVEVGPRGNLTAFIDDTLRGAPHLAVPANVAHRTGVAQLAHLMGLLAAHHVPMNLEHLYAHRSPRRLWTEDGRAPRERIMRAYLDTMDRFLEVQRDTMRALLGRGAPACHLPLLGSVVSLTPGRELVAVRRSSLEEDLFLADHTFGREVSLTDEALVALPVVPFTISMEMLAEAASALHPGQAVVGMRDVRAYQWVALDGGRATLRLVARQDPAGDGREVRVELWRLADDAAGTEAGTLVVEGTVVLAGAYPAPPVATELTLRAERGYAQATTNLYPERMFHGPRFQGVASLDRWGEDGIEATLAILPTADLFASTPDPALVTDPQLLDAAAQLAALWTVEHLGRGAVAFPFALAELQLFGPTLPPGTRVTGQARITSVTDREVHSDVDLVGPDGRLLARLTGWTYRRFELPSAFNRLWCSPRDAALGAPWTVLTDSLAEPAAFACCRIDELPIDVLAAHGRIWQRVLAHLVLSRRERSTWASLAGTDRRRSEWLLGRAAAKEAVRSFLRSSYDLRLCPADVEIIPDEWGKPLVTGAWTERVERVPVVSLSHCEGIAVAVAGDGGRCRGIGVDLERIDRVDDPLGCLGFTPHEGALVAALDGPERQEWALRLWCAKEAAGKALGRGLPHPASLVAADLEPATGVVRVAAGDRPAPLTVHTVRDGDWIAALSIRWLHPE